MANFRTVERTRVVSGGKIREARKALGLSQSDLAGRIGAHFTSVSDWERGRNQPSPRHLASIAAHTGKRVDDFFTDDAAREKQEAADDDEEARDPVKLFANLIESLDRRYGYARAS